MAVTVVTPASTTLLTTVGRVQAELGLTAGEDTDLLAGMIERASSAIARECRRVFGRETVTETLDGSGSRLLALSRTPIVSVASVTEDGVALAATEYAVEDAEAGALYRQDGWGRAGGYRMWGTEAFSSGYILPGSASTLRYAVTYTGGYLLPPAVTGRIVSKTFELSPIRQIVTVQPISVNALEGINDLDESSYGWVSEVGSRADTTTPTVGKYRIEAAEMYAAPKATQTLIDDSAVDIEMWLAMKVADKFARVEGAAFINGTGVGQPRGFATYTTAATADASRAWGTLEHVATSNSADFPSSNPGDTLFDLIAKFKSVYLQRAQWVTRREVIGTSIPVLGLRPTRARLARTWNTPKPSCGIVVPSCRATVGTVVWEVMSPTSPGLSRVCVGATPERVHMHAFTCASCTPPICQIPARW